MKNGQAGAVLLKLLGVAIGMVLIVVGAQDTLHVRSLKKTGHAATVEPIVGYTEFRKRGTSTYTAEFAFKTEDGRRITKRQSFPEGHIEDFKAGRPVKVYYDARDPSEFVFEKDGASWFLTAAGVGIAVVALIFG